MKKKIKIHPILLMGFVLILTTNSCKHDDGNNNENPPIVLPNCGTVTDIDGNVYNTITIGTQCWMKENLKVTHYRNGSSIPNVTDSVLWGNLTTGAYCIYNNEVNNSTTYGRLYNWYAVADSRNIAPSGWHVPTNGEWQILIDYLGDKPLAGGKLKETGTTHWQSPNTGATNESGFTALPGGCRSDYNYYSFYGIGICGVWWSSSGVEDITACDASVSYNLNAAGRDCIALKRYGLSIRCIKD